MTSDQAEIDSRLGQQRVDQTPMAPMMIMMTKGSDEQSTLEMRPPQPLEEIVCPITMEPIQEMVMTTTGSVYEKYAIREWLRYHRIDPCTGLPLQCTDLVPIRCKRNLKHKQRIVQRNARRRRRELWDVGGSSDRMEGVIEEEEGEEGEEALIHNELECRLRQLEHRKNRITNELSPIDQECWQEYAEQKRNQLQHPSAANPADTLMTEDGDNQGLEWTRIEDTGCDFELLDLSSLMVMPVHCDRLPKTFDQREFSGANLSGSHFIFCTFRDCKFVGADICETLFMHCRFEGDQTSFYASKLNTGTSFVGCSFLEENEVAPARQRKIDCATNDDINHGLKWLKTKGLSNVQAENVRAKH